MASTPKKMADSQYLPISATAAYTVADTSPTSIKQAVVREVFLCNTDAVPQTVTIYYVPKGGTAGGSNTFYSAYTLQAGETQRFSTATVLLPGDFISWLTSTASKVVGRISGIEYT